MTDALHTRRTARTTQARALPGAGTALGERLRKRRLERRISLRELARRLGISASLVSQIETGRIQPSVRTLYAIVSELGVSLDEVFSPDDETLAPLPEARPKRARYEAGRPVEGDTDPYAGRIRVVPATQRRAIELESGIRWERLAAWTDPEVEFLYNIYEVGGASSAANALVRHNGREYGIVTSGQLHVTVGFDEYVLGPGDSISFESSIPHRLYNTGPEPVHAVWIVLMD
jgi:transcriptional regulator with XRE-family HTH domain